MENSEIMEREHSIKKEHSGESFSYTYSAQEQAEIRDILSRYKPKEESKMDTLRRLDRQVTRKGMWVALTMGVIGTLLFGIGMCCCIEWDLFIPGVLVGVLGMTGVLGVMPIYNRITEKERQKIAPEIMKLTDELMK